ncbi:hypothetical protein JKP88DRAFT_136118, partial [Tribonema minus]
SAVEEFFLRLQDAKEDDACLVLPEGTYIMGEQERNSSILIRETYRELQTYITHEMAVKGAKRIIITGTPGIGKSCYAFYWMWTLLKAG